MEDLSSYPNAQLSKACRMLLADPDYIPGSGNDFSDDDDDDPLGQPENCLKINDDWTVSSQEHFHAVEYEPDDSDEDQAELEDRENPLADDSFNDITLISRRELNSSDEDEQVVPSTPKKICKLTFAVDEESTLSVRGVGEEEREIYKEEKEGEEEEEEKEEDPEEEKWKNKEVSDKDIAARFKADEKPVNRSSPQPP